MDGAAPLFVPDDDRPVAAPFDYAVLAGDADNVRAAAARIKQAHAKTIEGIVEIGAELLAVKTAVGHGHFMNWVAAEFAWSQMTATRYMNASSAFGANLTPVLNLPPATVYELASPSVPPTLREEIVSQLERGERPEPGAIVARIREEKEAIRKLKAQPRKDAERKKEERLKREREAERSKMEAEARVRNEALAAAAELIAEVFGERTDEIIELLNKAGSTVLGASVLRARARSFDHGAAA